MDTLHSCSIFSWSNRWRAALTQGSQDSGFGPRPGAYCKCDPWDCSWHTWGSGLLPSRSILGSISRVWSETHMEVLWRDHHDLVQTYNFAGADLDHALRGEGNRSPGISWHSHAGPGGHENRSLTPLSYGPPKGLFLVIKGTSQLFKVSYTLDMAPKPCPGILDSPILRVRGSCCYGSWEMWPVCIEVCYLSG